MSSPWSDEKLPMTAIAAPMAKVGPLTCSRSSTASVPAKQIITTYQAI